MGPRHPPGPVLVKLLTHFVHTLGPPIIPLSAPDVHHRPTCYPPSTTALATSTGSPILLRLLSSDAFPKIHCPPQLPRSKVTDPPCVVQQDHQHEPVGKYLKSQLMGRTRFCRVCGEEVGWDVDGVLGKEVSAWRHKTRRRGFILLCNNCSHHLFTLVLNDVSVA